MRLVAKRLKDMKLKPRWPLLQFSISMKEQKYSKNQFTLTDKDPISMGYGQKDANTHVCEYAHVCMLS